MDFKGWFRTGDGQRCDPFTVTDAHSRYLLTCRIIPPKTEAVRRECGLAQQLATDEAVSDDLMER
jgi:hypothetical protein